MITNMLECRHSNTNTLEHQHSTHRYKPCAPSLRYEIDNDTRVYVYANQSIDLDHAALTCDATNASCAIRRAKLFGAVGASVKNLEVHNETCFSFDMETWYDWSFVRVNRESIRNHFEVHVLEDLIVNQPSAVNQASAEQEYVKWTEVVIDSTAQVNDENAQPMSKAQFLTTVRSVRAQFQSCHSLHCNFVFKKYSNNANTNSLPLLSHVI